MTMLCSLFGCTAQTIGFRSVEAEEFGRIIADTTQAVTRLDVRTGKLPKDKTVAVYCRSGKRSKKAAAILVRNGYSVVELNSGYMGWTKAGMPTDR